MVPVDALDKVQPRLHPAPANAEERHPRQEGGLAPPSARGAEHPQGGNQALPSARRTHHSRR